MKEQIFVTGIGTEIGKTVCSAILTQYLKADYWKPVQSGDLHATDSMCIYDLLQGDVVIHPERYKLQLAASPHKSALLENTSILLEDFKIPETTNNLVIEGAGGLFVPLSDTCYIIDLIQTLTIPIALVIKDYLGCINHSVLSINAIKQRNMDLKYLIFNGDIDPDTEQVIALQIPEHTQIIYIPKLETVTAEAVRKITDHLTLKVI
jgi:dethiobiotin synthetase